MMKSRITVRHPFAALGLMALAIVVSAYGTYPPAGTSSGEDVLIIGQVSNNTATITYDLSKLQSGLKSVFAQLTGSTCTLTRVEIIRAEREPGVLSDTWVLRGTGTISDENGATIHLDLILQADGKLGLPSRLTSHTCSGVACKLCRFYTTTGCECGNCVPGHEGYCNHSTSQGMDRASHFK
ncbi:MAG: hypothetical protein SF053_08750 [Bacteroidia bacterium]|nr:hypothetical protein [Bacteroidia bacterium]